MAQVKTTGDSGLAVNVAIKPLPSKEIQRLSFVKSPETPPDTPADDVNISGVQGKERPTQISSNTDGAQGKTEPQDTLPEPYVQPVYEAKDEAVPASTDGVEVQSKVTPEDILPSSTTQRETKFSSKDAPASTDDSEIQSK
ncbi:MAG: hypothetical protein Q9199_000497 [Rusavskia elegans]